jgi:hypothetical protein
MQLNWLDRIGDWNPQLFREIKGRLKVRNVALAVATSLLGQLVLFLFWLGQVPNSENTYWGDPYCRLRDTYLANQQQSRQLQGQYRQLQQQFSRYSGSEHYDPEKIQQLKGSIQEHKERIEDLQKLHWATICPPDAINTQLWWHDHYLQIFASLSVFVLFALLVVGTYMLISDLAREERRGTLNFIRLSPQSPQSILSGKMLGVPILLYLAVVLTVPLHLWLGLSAQIPLVEIISFWAVLVASCAFFYSAALLFGLVSSWLGGFQAWLGSGAVLFFLWVANNKPIDDTPLAWLNLFCPSVVLPYLVDRTGSDYTEFPFSHGVIQNWEWFNLPLGATGVTVVIFVLLNYSLWTGWIWQALKRCFCNPNTTILSKRQSYWLVTCFEVVILGFAMGVGQGYYFGSQNIFTNPLLVGCFNLILFLGLIAVLSPHRQALQDWARYRRESVSTRKGFWHRTLVKDLMRGEKSPSLIAIAINLVIAITPFLVWILLLPTEYLDKIKGLFAVAFFISLMMIYASIFQLMLLMKTNKRSLWATGTIVALLVLPPMIIGVLCIDTIQNPTLWLFSTFPWVGIEHATTTTMFMALLGEWGVLVLLNLKLTRQLRRAGESASKALFTRSPVH